MTDKVAMPAGTTGGAPQVLLAHHLKQLKLPTVLREYDKLDTRKNLPFRQACDSIALTEQEGRSCDRRDCSGFRSTWSG